jgi:hypothetical protein
VILAAEDIPSERIVARMGLYCSESLALHYYYYIIIKPVVESINLVDSAELESQWNIKAAMIFGHSIRCIIGVIEAIS